MNKKILLSMLTIGVTLAMVVGATTALFSDTETSTGNTFTAGTIDISIDNQNPWSESFTMADMKPCYTDYINFRIDNDGSDPNPVNVWKKLYDIVEGTGTQSEPECDAEQWSGGWNGSVCTGSPSAQDNEISKVIWYDLNVKVYDSGDNLLFWQTIYVDGEYTIDDVYDVYGAGKEAYLGMIPANGYMLVEQSYHMKQDADNEYQGDTMSFNIDVRAEQLTGTALLENKDESQDWKIIHGDGIEGTLTYEVKHPTFDFDFTGTVPAAGYGQQYDLVVITNDANDTGVLLGTAIANGINGSISISGDMNTGDMKDVKVWLLRHGHLNVTTGAWSGYTPNDYLWETGLIWYEDTD